MLGAKADVQARLTQVQSTSRGGLGARRRRKRPISLSFGWADASSARAAQAPCSKMWNSRRAGRRARRRARPRPTKNCPSLRKLSGIGRKRLPHKRAANSQLYFAKGYLWLGSMAMASISMPTSRGSRATSTVVRAGGFNRPAASRTNLRFSITRVACS